jgi:hypothetical protein
VLINLLEMLVNADVNSLRSGMQMEIFDLIYEVAKDHEPINVSTKKII